MSDHRSPHNSRRRRPPRTGTDRYNSASPSTGLSGLLELEQDDADRPVLGEIEVERDGSRPASSSPKRRAAPRRSPSPKSQPLKSKKPTAARATTAKSLPRRKSKTHDLKATAAPLLATVGVLLLIPAVWSTLLLIGVGVPGADRQDARPMATVMLLSWPIAICLIAASSFFFVQVIRQRKQPARK